MDGPTAVAQVQQGLGFRSDRATEIISALNFAMNEREQPGKTLPWFMVAEDQTVTALATNQAISLPAGFVKERESRDGNLRYRSATAGSRTFFLQKGDIQSLDRYFFGDWQNNWDTNAQSTANALTPGMPRAYALRGATIKVYPVPDVDYGLTWDFYKNSDPITLATSATHPWLLNSPWVLVSDAGLKLAADIQNQAAMTKFATMALMASQTLMGSIVERELAGRPLRMGGKL